MATKYLDSTGLTYLWSKIKTWVGTYASITTSGGTSSLTVGNTTVVVPNKTSQLTNDSNFITSADVPEGATASTTTPKMDGTAAVGTETAFARGDHRHPSDTSKADKSATVSNVAYDSTNKKITKTINGTTSDIVTIETLSDEVADNLVYEAELTGTATYDSNSFPPYTNLTITNGTSALFNTIKEKANKGYFIQIKLSLAISTSGTTSTSVYYLTNPYQHTIDNSASFKQIRITSVNGTPVGLMLSCSASSWNLIADTYGYSVKAENVTNRKLYIVGAENQSYYPSTFTQSTAYIGTDGCLYSNSSKVMTAGDIGAANGIAPLDANSKIDAQYLPSYVDDVIEAYPRSGQTELSQNWLSTTSGGSALTPETGKIYVLMANSTSYNAGAQFRWGGTTYVKLNDGGISSITNAEIDAITAN